MGERVFGVRPEPKTDRSTEIGNPSRYDFEYDTLTVFTNAVEKASTEGLDTGEVVKYSVAHECGHAAEARAFASAGLFPFRAQISRSSAVAVEGARIPMSRLSPQLQWLLNSLLEFGVNQRLLDVLGLKDKLASRRISELSQPRPPPADTVERAMRVIDGMFGLAFDVDLHEHGSLVEEERQLIEEAVTSPVGRRRWLAGLNAIRNRSYGDALGYKKMVERYFDGVLGVRVSFVSIDRSQLGVLPNFWEGRSYEVLSLN
jgi:hypothetical protein